MYKRKDARMHLNHSKLVKEGLTTPVYTAFVNSICSAANKHPLSNYDIEDERVLQCMESQEMLGLESILCGFHHVDWLTLLRDTWGPPKESPDGKSKEKRKDPLEQSYWSEDHGISWMN
ncbi:LOW QUALITY PROTEIN: hypothetical protein ACHAXN_000878 [Cyclotella atomus]